MKKCAILLPVLILALGGLLAAKETILKVRVQAANVRSAADAAAPVIAKVGLGTLLEASGREGAWYRIKVSNAAGKEVTGFIHNSVVGLVGGDEEEESAPPRAAAGRRAPYAPGRGFASGGFKLLGGLSLASLQIPREFIPGAKRTSRTGLMGGAGYESGGRLALELDLLYAQGGVVLKDADNPDNKKKVTFASGAVTLPVMLKLRFLPGTTPYLLAGGEVGYVLSHKTVISDAGGNETEKDSIAEIHRLLYGVVFGGGVELRAGGMDLLLEARYRLGLANMVKEPDPGESMKATSLSFLLAIRF